MWGRCFVVAAVLTVQAAPATACFFHALTGAGLVVGHATTVPVALATRAAQDEGLLPIVPRANERALTELSVINAYLPTLAVRTLDGRSFAAFSVLQLQSQTWTRYATGPEGLTVETHLEGPAPGDAIVVVADTTLALLLAGRLELGTARDRGLVAVTGADGTDQIFAAITAAFRESAVGRAVAEVRWDASEG